MLSIAFLHDPGLEGLDLDLDGLAVRIGGFDLFVELERLAQLLSGLETAGEGELGLDRKFAVRALLQGLAVIGFGIVEPSFGKGRGAESEIRKLRLGPVREFLHLAGPGPSGLVDLAQAE